jgi:hypothetical protein
LIKCYKYNSKSCCTSVHDDYIYNYIGNILTASCVRRYPSLEDYVCYGCNPSEYIYTDNVNKILTFCASFALKLWNGTVLSDLDSPTTIFDNCGFKVPSDNTALTELAKNKPYIIPSEVFKSFTDFATYIRIPFFDGYTVQIYDDLSNTSKNKTGICYGSSNFIQIELIILLFIVGFIF